MNKRTKEDLLIFLVDGFNGILALMLYNFLLYTFIFLEFIAIKLKKDAGYFYLNMLEMFKLDNTSKWIWVLSIFLFAFALGSIVGNIVRKRKGVRF